VLRRAATIEPMIGIARVTETLFVFFKPCVESIEVERDEITERRRTLRWSRVTPCESDST